MHLSIFISSLLTLSHTGLYPLSPAPWPSSTGFIVKSDETYNPVECSRTEVLNRIEVALSRLNHRIMKNIAENKDLKSFIVSPLAISLAISMLTSTPGKEKPSIGTKCNSIECLEVMGMQPLVDHLADYQSTGLSLASCVFVSPKLELSPEFIETVTKNFRTPLRRVNFEDTTERNDFISKWGANQVTGLVESDTSLALINVIHFQGEWAQKFSESNTFTIPLGDDYEESSGITYMSITAYVRHGRHPEIDADFYELPFQSEDDARNISMFIITPNKLVKPVPSIWNLFEDSTIEKLLSSGAYGPLTIFLPKFRIESLVDIRAAVVETPLLPEDRIFDRGSTKFGRITGSSRLFGDKFVQRMSVEVNEEGCTAVTSDTLEDPQPLKNIIPNSPPFYVLIATTDKNPEILFSGRI